MKMLRFSLRAVLIASAAAVAVPASAATYVLDFANTNCATTCNNYDDFLQSYGDAPGVDVQYQSLVGPGNSALDYTNLNYWSTGYGDLEGVIWGGTGNTTGVPEIRFVATGADGVTINSFDMAGYLFSDQPTDVRIYDLAYNLLYSSGAFQAPGQGHVTITPGISNLSGLILQWGPNGFNAGVDNLSFSVGPLNGAVPEPATWAMMLAGFGAIGMAMRNQNGRRRKVNVSFA